jgi:2-polyprenyl-3-methyl-5-hydroxy-6-metoxy-1,4-benzoquinol methylase
VITHRLAPHALRRCRACAHRFLEVEAPAQLEAMYDDHYAGFRPDPVFHREATRLVKDELVRYVRPPARVLDVGCGNGEFLAIARDAGYQGLGVDVSAAAGDLCRQRGLAIEIGDFRTMTVGAPDARFELITFWDVVEHLPDPGSFLERAHELLAPGGYALIKTPRTSAASVAVAGTVPRLAGALLSAPSHVQYFSEAGLAALLRRVGFAEVELLAPRGMRQPGRGKSLRRRVARRVVSTFQRVVGDRNILALARRAG